MIILIDGYNVLKRLNPQEIGDRQRQAFIAACNHYAQAKGHTPIIVFDAGSSSMVHKEHHKKVEVVYTGHKKSADDYIKEYVHKHAGKNILVVSADRELGRQVSNAGATIMEPEAFTHLLKQKYSEQGQHTAALAKTADSADHDLDELMRQAANQAVHKQEVSGVSERKSPSSKISKEEKKLLKKIQKL